MHATIAVAARCAERDPVPTRAEARDLAREVALACGLDGRDVEALQRAAESFVAPPEVCADDVFDDLPCVAECAQDHDAGDLPGTVERRLEAPVHSPEAALFDAADNFAELLDILVQGQDGRHVPATSPLPDLTYVVFIEHTASPEPPCSVSTWLPTPRWLSRGELHEGALMRAWTVTSHDKQKLLQSCDFHTRSEAVGIRGQLEAITSWFGRLSAHELGRVRLAVPVRTPHARLVLSELDPDRNAALWRHLRELEASRRCTQTVFFFVHDPQQRSWPTQVDWSIPATPADRVPNALGVSQDASEEVEDQRLASFFRWLAK
jgi:hypothetical protein